MPRRKGDFFDTTRNFWLIQKMMDEEEERRNSWDNDKDNSGFFDDFDEFGEDTNEDMGFESDFDDDFLLGLTDTPFAWREEYDDAFREYNVDPQDYDTEDEFMEALEEAKTAWRREYSEAYLEHNVDP